MEEIREIKLPGDIGLLEGFLMVDPVEFMHLLFKLREKQFPKTYAGISNDTIKTLVTFEKEDSMISISKGDLKFVKPILKKWGPTRGYFSIGLKHLHAVLEIYKPIRVFDEIFTMFVDREHFIFKPKHKAVRLSSEELPEPWTKDFKGIAYGIRVNNRVVSVGTVSNMVDGIGFSGAGMRTDSEYRNKGYASSTLAYAVQNALDIAPIINYPVESTNLSALRVLEKLGFRYYSAFLYTQLAKK